MPDCVDTGGILTEKTVCPRIAVETVLYACVNSVEGSTHRSCMYLVRRTGACIGLCTRVACRHSGPDVFIRPFTTRHRIGFVAFE